MTIIRRDGTLFRQLNEGWNAEPVDPELSVSLQGADLVVSLRPNRYQFPEYLGISWIALTFRSCSRYRIGKTNDEGWYLGQCRFSRFAPAWGEFYEVSGNLRLEKLEDDWIFLAPLAEASKHYLFYMKDETFECDALGSSKEELR